jgi:sporulation protein YlmC with PRC-barrel domain
MRSLEIRSLPKASARSVTTVSIVGADEMLGSRVVDCDGTRIGELRDMMLDLRAARVAYGVVVLDRAPDWSERLVAVPWNVMHIDGNGELRVNAHRDWIERAPSMQPELMPTLLDHEWAVFIHSYFGAKPYWEHNAQHA